MSNKTVTLSLFCFVLLIFIVYYAFFNTVLPGGEPIKSQLASLIKYVEQEQWNEAQKTFDNVENTWNKTKFILVLNYGEADYSLFIEYLSKLRTSVRSKERVEASKDADVIIALWNNFVRVIPEP